MGVTRPTGGISFIMDPDTANPAPDSGICFLLFFAFLALGALVVLCQNSLVELSDQKLKRAGGEPGAGPGLERAARLLEHPGRFASAMRGAYTFCHLCSVGFLAQWAEEGAIFAHPFWAGGWGGCSSAGPPCWAGWCWWASG